MVSGETSPGSVTISAQHPMGLTFESTHLVAEQTISTSLSEPLRRHDTTTPRTRHRPS